MVLPIPMSSAAGALPQSFVKTMTIVFSIILGIELGLSVARFYVLDIWGGVIMTLITVFGAFVVKNKFDPQWTMMFAITLFFYGLVHFVMLLERVVVVWPVFPDVHAKDIRILMRDIVLIAAPVIDWALCGLSWYCFRRATSAAYAGSTDEERQPLARSSSRLTASSFTPFSGEGRKLA